MADPQQPSPDILARLFAPTSIPADAGRVKHVDRRLVAKCQLCDVSLPQSEGTDEWVWIARIDVQTFLATHRRHAPDKLVGIEVEMIEKESS